MEKPNIIIIIVDTLRKDYSKPLEDALTKIGFVSHENAIAPAPWTVPTHASIFTGLYPLYHGAHETKESEKKVERLNIKLKKTDNLLSIELQELGYVTYLLSTNVQVSPLFGFKGFDHFYVATARFSLFLSIEDKYIIHKIINELESDKNINLNLVKALIKDRRYSLVLKGAMDKIIGSSVYWYNERIRKCSLDKGAKEMVRNFNKIWSNQNQKDAKFIFINLMEMHEPYFKGHNMLKHFVMNLNGGKIDPACLQKCKENYPRAVEYVTKNILDMVKILKRKGTFENSLIIVTSDHGQLLGEHNRIGHGTFLYDELLRVPFMIKYPRGWNVSNTDSRAKYVALTRVKSFVLEMLNNHKLDIGKLYQDTVFAESYGITCDLKKLANKYCGGLSEEGKRSLEELERYRIAVYHRNFKGIFNVGSWSFDEITSCDPDIEVTEKVKEQMKKEVARFLRNAAMAKTLKIQ